MVGLRTGIVAHGFILPVLMLWGCGSDSPPKPAAQVDGGTDVHQGAADGPVADVPVTSPTDAPSAPEGRAVDVSGIEGRSQDGGVCQSPLVFPSDSGPPSMCPGVVLKTAAIPFVPTDSHWSTLYQGCLDSSGSPYYSDACRKLCTTVATASPALKSSQGIDSCSLDCSQSDNPVLSVKYSDTICEPSIPDAGSGSEAGREAGRDGTPDAGIDGVRVAALDGAPDAGTGLDASDGGGSLQVALQDVSAYANCMPVVGSNPDPIIVLWTVDITGARGDTAQLTKATITVSKGTSIVQDFTVANPTIPLVGGTGSASQRKPLDSVSTNQACSSMCGGGATYQLDLVFAIDGQSIPVSKSGAFSCAY